MNHLILCGYCSHYKPKNKQYYCECLGPTTWVLKEQEFLDQDFNCSVELLTKLNYPGVLSANNNSDKLKIIALANWADSIAR